MKKGFEGYLYRRSSGNYASPTFSLILCGDVTLPDSMEELPASQKGSGGIAQFMTGERTVALEFGLLYQPTDTQHIALEASYAARTAEDILMLDGLLATVGSKGVRIQGLVSKYERGEPLNGLMTRDVRIVPTVDANAVVAYTVES